MAASPGEHRRHGRRPTVGLALLPCLRRTGAVDLRDMDAGHLSGRGADPDPVARGSLNSDRLGGLCSISQPAARGYPDVVIGRSRSAAGSSRCSGSQVRVRRSTLCSLLDASMSASPALQGRVAATDRDQDGLSGTQKLQLRLRNQGTSALDRRIQVMYTRPGVYGHPRFVCDRWSSFERDPQ